MVDVILSRLNNVRKSSEGRWMACCPAHTDRSPSLSIREADDGTLLVKCFAGCNISNVMTAVGMTVADLFPNSPQNSLAQKTARLNWISNQSQAEVEACRLRLDLAKDMRARGIRLTKSDMQTERHAFMRLRELQEGLV